MSKSVVWKCTHTHTQTHGYIFPTLFCYSISPHCLLDSVSHPCHFLFFFRYCFSPNTRALCLLNALVTSKVPFIREYRFRIMLMRWFPSLKTKSFILLDDRWSFITGLTESVHVFVPSIVLFCAASIHRVMAVNQIVRWMNEWNITNDGI